jgi:hypothetical protein
VNDDREPLTIRVGEIYNYYGGLYVRRNLKGQAQWGLENYGKMEWENIPESLYLELMRFATKEEV